MRRREYLPLHFLKKFLARDVCVICRHRIPIPGDTKEKESSALCGGSNFR